MTVRIGRRTMLKGIGASVALPFLDAMLPRSLVRAAAAEEAAVSPVRTAFVFTPNGFVMPSFTPAGTGGAFALPATLQPLAARRDDLLVLSGLALDNARAKGDGPGDHARASAAFLTCAHPRKTDGRDIRLGVSADQVLAKAVGAKTILPSLELGCDRSAQTGRCDSGYSCAYVSNVSWTSETTPAPKEANPRIVFERLFGSSEDRRDAKARAERIARRRSVLDWVRGDARRLSRELGTEDRAKLEEYTTSLREVERRIERAETESGDAVATAPDVPMPTGIPPSYRDHLRLMYDLIVLAFRTDRTRVVSFMAANAGSNRSYPEVDVPQGHHHLSHHKGDEAKIERIRRIDRFQIEQFAYFLERLAETLDDPGSPGSGRLLDRCQIVLGSGIADGNRHSHHDLPILVAGGAGGALSPGRHLRYPRNTPLANLYLRLLENAGVRRDRFADSTETLTV